MTSPLNTLSNNYLLNVDIKKKLANTVPIIRQGDNAKLRFKMFDNGKLLDLSGYTRSELAFSLPNGERYVGTCELVNGIVEYTFVGTEMSYVGDVSVLLTVFAGETSVSIQPFRVHIYDTMRGDNLSYLEMLRDLINTVQLLEAQIAPKIKELTEFRNETEKFVKQIDVKATEIKQLHESVSSAETTRKANETTRLNSENARVTSETDRQAKEAVRRTSETARVNAENLRLSAESARDTSEKTRSTNETTRINAETARISAENTRSTNESTRVASESTRVNAENARISSETARSASESLRKSSENARVASEQQRVNKEADRLREEATRVLNEDVRIKNENDRKVAFKDKIDELDTYIDEFVFKGDYSPTVTYQKNNVVYYNGSSFVALKSNMAITPSDNKVDWQLVAQRGVDGTGSVSSVNGIFPDISGNVTLDIDKSDLVNNATFNTHANNSDIHVTSQDKTKWNNKAENVLATTAVDGLMSKQDKLKLSTVQSGANATVILDDLTSVSATSGLSANKGRELDEKFTTHSNTQATASQIGHVKLSSSTSSVSETEAATPKAIKTVNDIVTQHLEQNHPDSNTLKLGNFTIRYNPTQNSLDFEVV